MATGPANPNIQALSSALAVVIAQHASPPSTQPSGATTQPSPALSGASTDGSAGSALNRYVGYPRNFNIILFEFLPETAARIANMI